MSELAIYKNESQEERYLVFNVNKELYAINVSRIDNIIMMPSIRRVPCAPKCFNGIINLRGEIIPVMSLGRRLGAATDELTNRSRVIIVKIGNDELMGVIVDGVKEVLTFSDNEIEQPSPFLRKETTLVTGVGKKDDELISIIDSESLLDREMVS
ncbi:chemotaxis protein CheW [Butyrivibrio sp. VCD2006]|uniref:chemotaxis protein CheW n=1 Tax=Butyrivibrio sp. VCD2006 TaxID=1280664 RepID=UPI000423E699|nr:chemotaxis protein CheW [Butyrivibrio sp. VCD2006]